MKGYDSSMDDITPLEKIQVYPLTHLVGFQLPFFNRQVLSAIADDFAQASSPVQETERGIISYDD
jgi:hypothetical protein